MTPPREGDLVRLTAPAGTLFGAAVIPAGADGVVLMAWPDGACLAEFALRPQSAGHDGEPARAALAASQYEVTGRPGGARPGQVVLALTPGELRLLAGCVNEAVEAVEDWEFPTRLGAGKEDARALRAQLARLTGQLPPG